MSIQVDNGEFTRLHNVILEKLAVARLVASEYRCLMFLFRETYGWQRKEHDISMTAWARGVGIDPDKRQNVWRTLQGMIAKRVIYAKPNGNNRPMTWGFNKHFDEWDASLFEETVITQDNSCADETVITPDNSQSPTVITDDNTSVITQDNSTVITGDNTNIRRNIYTKKPKEKKKDIAADAASPPSPNGESEKPKRSRKRRDPPSSESPPRQEPTEWQEFVGAFCWLCHGHMEVGTLKEVQKQALLSEAKTVRDGGYTVDDLRSWYKKVWKTGWQVEKKPDARPTPADVRSSIAQLRAKTPTGFEVERNGANHGHNGHSTKHHEPPPSATFSQREWDNYRDPRAEEIPY